LKTISGRRWLLDLWKAEPARSREITIAKVLKRNRIRRFNAAHVLDVLGRPPVQVAAGTIEAASVHLVTSLRASVSSTVKLKDAHL
jgi:hypothetical protein